MRYLSEKENPVRKIPFPAWPFFAEDEMAAVANVLQSGKVNYWTGEECRLFEKEFAARVGVKKWQERKLRRKFS